ncbi:MAG: hypothetical protein ACE5LU_26150 [Anaerolineae bacterium]
MKKADGPADKRTYLTVDQAQAAIMVTCAIALSKDDILDSQFIAGPLHEEQGFPYAEIDPQQMRGPRWNLDVAGHYARPDVFQLTVRKEPRPMIAVAALVIVSATCSAIW